MRWLFHVVPSHELEFNGEQRYAPPSLESEGFIHASYQEAVRESARLYFSDLPADGLRVLAIDPRRLDVPVKIAETPRGPMPHVHGAVPCDAVRVLDFDELDRHPDRVTGTHFGFVAFEGMTLLDLVGPLDAVSRIASMGFDPTSTTEVIALTHSGQNAETRPRVWSGSGASFAASRYRPELDDFDVLIVPGGLGTRELARDGELTAYLSTFPANRLVASVCTGALLLGAMGRLAGKPATTHQSALSLLAEYGAIPRRERVVDAGSVVTAGGVTAGIDLGLHLVRRFVAESVADAVARQMEVRA